MHCSCIGVQIDLYISLGHGHAVNVHVAFSYKQTMVYFCTCAYTSFLTTKTTAVMIVLSIEFFLVCVTCVVVELYMRQRLSSDCSF